ncbi:MAG: OsmC family protein [Chloroflexi bacterium]|nr:OsmC family protein [Chloroflexota bacterium]MCI0648334.1 OsmC family protein [Chloroflexota bacterium]MCI0730136.1 OsmC family protein [Chloroflexota bacterium]
MTENTKINGLDIAATRAAIATVGAQPGSSKAPKKSRVRWLSGLKFKAAIRNHEFIVDEPAHLAGEDESPNSMEYVLGAYGACLATGVVLNASQRGIAIHNLEVAVSSTQDNVFTFLGLGSEGHPGFDEIVAKLYVQADADEATLQEIWEHTIKTSPVHNTLARPVTIRAEMDFIP